MMQSVRPQTQYVICLRQREETLFPPHDRGTWHVARSEISGRLPLFRAQSVPSYL